MYIVTNVTTLRHVQYVILLITQINNLIRIQSTELHIN